MTKKRDWKQYEKELGEGTKKLRFHHEPANCQRIAGGAGKAQQRKKGRKYQIPKSVLLLFHFLKHLFRIDDRLLAKFMSNFMNTLFPRPTPFDHSTIVKRRDDWICLCPQA